MPSNSKLSKSQKAELKQFKQENPDVFFAHAEHVTVAMRQTSETMAEFSLAIASDTEKKIRRKVGEFNAAQRFWYFNTLPIKFHCNSNIEEAAQDLVDVLADIS